MEAGGARVDRERKTRAKERDGEVTATFPTFAGWEISLLGEPIVATTAGGTASFHHGHGGVETMAWSVEPESAAICIIMQWCAPLRRQHAGRLAVAWAPANNGCNGNKAVNSSNKDAAQRLTAQHIIADHCLAYEKTAHLRETNAGCGSVSA